jgi:AcrR family transcriptional regulator
MRSRDYARPVPPRDHGNRATMRADARDNRRRLLVAARDAFTERGPGAPLDEIARRAGTGIATLYRHFPDRKALMLEVIRDAIEQTIEDARQAAAEEPDPFRALARYMHRVVDARTAAVIPSLLGAVPLDDEQVREARETGPAILQAMVDAAQRAGTLRADVTAADIGMLMVRMSRLLPGGFDPETNAGLSHRHLDLVLDGLRAAGQQSARLGGPELSMADLRGIPQPGPPAT